MNKYCQVKQDKLIWSFDGETVQIEPWGTNSLRIRAIPIGEIQNKDYALMEPDEVSRVKITSNDQGSSIQNGRIKAVITDIDEKFSGRQKEMGQIAFYKDGKKILEEIGISGRLKLKARSFEAKGSSYQLSMTFNCLPGERIYGMGQYQDGLFDLKGSSRELAQRNSQASVPFYYSSLGYGFLWNNPAIGEVNFDKQHTKWSAEETDQLDYWITAADTPSEILKQYTSVTGRVPEMPDYGLGLWQSRMRYYNQKQVIEVAEKYHTLGIPLDVLIIDFFHWPKQGDYRFDERFFPDPKKMANRLKELGVKLMVSVWPQVDYASENFNDMRVKGLLVKNNQGIPIQMDFQGNIRFLDFTNPKSRAYIWQIIKKNYQDQGVSMFWLDEAEPEYTNYDFRNYKYYLGDVLKVGNIYPFYYSKAFYDGMKQQNQTKIVNLVRCAWAGSQRFGALVWSGDVYSDFKSLKEQLVAGLQMGMAGIPWWTTDTGGFHGGDVHSKDFRELLMRWFAFSTFSPVLRLHGERLPFERVTDENGNEMLHTGAPNELWSFGDDVFKVLKKFVMIREKLRPYLKQVMSVAHQAGAPVMRPLFWQYSDDNQCWNISDEYLLGDKLLVAPVLQKGSSKRTVYLPAGEDWYSLTNGQNYQGGTTITIEADITTIPLFTQVKNSTQFDEIYKLLRG